MPTFAAFSNKSLLLTSITTSDKMPIIEGHTVIETDDVLDITRFYILRDGKIVRNDPPGDPIYYDCVNGIWEYNMERANWILSENAKGQRNQLLLDSDWTDTLSAKARLGDDLYNAWQSYRQALRDITTQPGYPFEIVWPTPPM